MEMKNTDISGDTRIGDIATALPASMRIFEQYGVDFCCGGDKPLAEALQGTGLSLENVRAEIEEATTAEPQGSAAHRDLAHATPEKLIEHILDTHHRYLKRELPGLEKHLETVISVHGDGHPELHELGRLFSELKGEIEGHLDREEKETFPAVRTISKGDGSAVAAILGQMEALEREHDTVGGALKNMRGLTPTRTRWSDGAEPAPAVAIRADRAISCCQRAFSAQPHPSATGYPRWDSALWGRPPRSSLWCGTDKTRAHYQR